MTEHQMDRESPFQITDRRGTNRGNGKTSVEPELTEEQLELLAQQAAADDSTPVASDATAVVTAFVIAVNYDGSVLATSELGTLERFDIGREATFADMYSACAQTMKDVQSMDVAQRVINAIQAQAQQAMAARQAEAIHQQIRTRPGPRG